MKKQNNTTEKRIVRNKELLLTQLEKLPIIQIACEKINIGRATYYRWRKDDYEFALKADKAIQKGNLFINDLAESQLISAIRNGHMTAIIYWLKHHHKAYATKVELLGTLETQHKLTKNQEELFKKAVNLVFGKEKHE